ncbi:MAG: universal stress protein [Geminicoccaceae bacterium]
MFRTIVCATDGSDHGAHAVRIAADIAARYAARLVIVHAVAEGKPPAALRHMVETEHMVEEGEPDPIRVSRAIVTKVLDEATDAAQAAGAPDVSTHLETGDPATVILDACHSLKADLVVMGSRGLSELKGLLVGSVSHKVGQLAPCPCLTVK